MVHKSSIGVKNNLILKLHFASLRIIRVTNMKIHVYIVLKTA